MNRNLKTMKIPENITFEQAIALTESLLDKMAKGELPPEEITNAIAELVPTKNGARGFFVAYLTSDHPFADNHPPEVLQGLSSHPLAIAELLAKNLAMSAAMVLTHQRNGNEEMAQSSARVRDRSKTLINQLNLPEVWEKCQQLQTAATTGEGQYQAFLERWGYDREQLQLMIDNLTFAPEVRLHPA